MRAPHHLAPLGSAVRVLAIAALVLQSCAAPTPTSATADPIPDAARSAVATMLREARTQHGFPGCVVAIAPKDAPITVIAEGHAEGTTLDEHSRFLSGSIGKTYLGAIAAQLAAEGRIELDQPIVDRIGNADWFARLPNHAQITLRHLLRHQSGLRDHVWDPDFQRELLAAPDKVWDVRDLIGYLADTEALFEPGSGWAYSDTNYLIAGLVIETVTERSFATHFAGLLRDRFELRDTALSDRRELPGLVNGLASGLAFHRGPVLADGRYFVNPQFEDRGGGMYSTPADLARFVRELLAGSEYPVAARSILLETVATRSRVCERYGLGVMVDSTPLGPRIGHSGFMPGFLSRVSWYPEHELAIAIQFCTDDARTIGGTLETWTDRIVSEIAKGATLGEDPSAGR
ncbi:MAG: serine hydrolase domain-containing protein [Planctomycetota bacterium]